MEKPRDLFYSMSTVINSFKDPFEAIGNYRQHTAVKDDIGVVQPILIVHLNGFAMSPLIWGRRSVESKKS